MRRIGGCNPCCGDEPLDAFCTHGRATVLLEQSWADNLSDEFPGGGSYVVALASIVGFVAAVGREEGGKFVAQLWDFNGNRQWSVDIGRMPVDVAMDDEFVYVALAFPGGLSNFDNILKLSISDGSTVASWNTMDGGPEVEPYTIPRRIAVSGGNVLVAGTGVYALSLWDGTGTLLASSFGWDRTDLWDVAVDDSGNVYVTGNATELQGYSQIGQETCATTDEMTEEEIADIECDTRCREWDTWALSSDLSDVLWAKGGSCLSVSCGQCNTAPGRAIAVRNGMVFIGYNRGPVIGTPGGGDNAHSTDCGPDELLCTLQARDAGTGEILWGQNVGSVWDLAATQSSLFVADGALTFTQVDQGGTILGCFVRKGEVTLETGTTRDFTGSAAAVAGVEGTDEVYFGGTPSGCGVEAVECSDLTCVLCGEDPPPPDSSSEDSSEQDESSSETGCPCPAGDCEECTPDIFNLPIYGFGCWEPTETTAAMSRSGCTWSGSFTDHCNDVFNISFTLSGGSWSGEISGCAGTKALTILDEPCSGDDLAFPFPVWMVEVTAAEAAGCCALSGGCDGGFAGFPVEDGCSECPDGAPSEWVVHIPGITNGSCESCTEFDGAIVSHAGDCNWVLPLGVCGLAQVAVIVSDVAPHPLQVVFSRAKGAPEATYATVDESLNAVAANCLGSNTLRRTGGTQSVCNDWPDEITVEPA